MFKKKMCFEIFLERGERWRVADSCRKRVQDFSCLKVERSVSSRFKVSLGDFFFSFFFFLSFFFLLFFFTDGPKISRVSVDLKQF